ncbi:hypothetical protein [Caviibacter abscessus]|uniref:hypothetical protein n=1 Tax=Caviibacter abscessus TaxID=1766719 RepID=UPI000830A00F|nr:hypothetical protein [Caviibacter abscessus]
MKKYLIFIMFPSFLLAGTIDYNRLYERKKVFMKLNDTQKDYKMESLIYEADIYEGIMENKTSGENYINFLNNKKTKNMFAKVYAYSFGNKEKYFISSKIAINKPFTLYGNEANIGAVLGYNHLNNLNDVSNGISIGINAAYTVPDLKLQLFTQHEFNYNFQKFDVGFSNHYFGVSGVINARFLLGKKFFIEPNVNLAYNYNFKRSVLDQNKDKITMMPAMNITVGGSVKIGYKFGENPKVKLYASYGLNKKLNNVNKYTIYGKDVIMSKNNYMSHYFDIGSDILIKDTHKISLSLGILTQGYRGGASYKFEW